MDKDIINSVSSAGGNVIPASNSLYAVVVFHPQAASPVIVLTMAPIAIPPLGEIFEIRQSGQSFAGRITAKETILSDQGISLNHTTSITLTP